jgi:outer membrane protein assembly factor BamE (lipoprotein component of BamABCDE complex)
MKTLYLATAIVLALGLAACSPIEATRGNLISETKFQQVITEKSTRNDVLRVWGPPTITSSFDPNTWYYIGEATRQKGIFEPEVEVRRIIRVRFDSLNNDTVTEISDLDPKQAKNVELVDRTTPTAGKKFNAMQQFIGNLGKYNADPGKK